MSDYRKHPTRRLGPGQYDGVYGGVTFQVTKVHIPKNPYQNRRAFTHWFVYIHLDKGEKLYGACTKEEAVHDALVFIDTYWRREIQKSRVAKATA